MARRSAADGECEIRSSLSAGWDGWPECKLVYAYYTTYSGLYPFLTAGMGGLKASRFASRPAGRPAGRLTKYSVSGSIGGARE